MKLNYIQNYQINFLHLFVFLGIILLLIYVLISMVTTRLKLRRFYENSFHASVGQSVWSFHSVSLLPFPVFGILASDPVRYGRLGYGGLRSNRIPHQRLYCQELPQIAAEGTR